MGCRVLRLIESNIAATRQLHARDGTPSFFMNRRTADALFSERRHFRLQVVAQEIKFVQTVLFRWMEGGLAGRQREDQPAMACIDGLETENVAKECAIRFRIFAVNNYVSARDHAALQI